MPAQCTCSFALSLGEISCIYPGLDRHDISIQYDENFVWLQIEVCRQANGNCWPPESRPAATLLLSSLTQANGIHALNLRLITCYEASAHCADPTNSTPAARRLAESSAESRGYTLTCAGRECVYLG